MANPFAVLDLSDDEGAPNLSALTAKKETKPASTGNNNNNNNSSKQPEKKKDHNTLKQEEENLKQPKKGLPGARGGQHGGPQQGSAVTYPQERSKTGAKKEDHVNTHKLGENAPTRGREYDRHRPGTGRRDNEKKGGAGGHNWGKPGDELAQPLPASSPEPTSATGAAVAAGGGGGEGGAQQEQTPAVQEPEKDLTKTLEDYEKERLAKRSGDAFAEKQARKVEVPSDLAGKVLKKDETLDEYDNVKLDKEEGDKKKKEKQQKTKNVMDIDYTFSQPQSEPARTGGGGGDRRPGGGDRRGGNNDRRSSPRGPPGGGAGGNEEGGGDRRPAFKNNNGPRPPRQFNNAPRTGGNTPGGARLDTGDVAAFPKLGGVA